jgi:hypothetical protein
MLTVLRGLAESRGRAKARDVRFAQEALGAPRREAMDANRVPSIRLSRTPQPLAGYPLRGRLRKSCFAA